MPLLPVIGSACVYLVLFCMCCILDVTTCLDYTFSVRCRHLSMLFLKKPLLLLANHGWGKHVKMGRVKMTQRVAGLRKYRVWHPPPPPPPIETSEPQLQRKFTLHFNHVTFLNRCTCTLCLMTKGFVFGSVFSAILTVPVTNISSFSF